MEFLFSLSAAAGAREERDVQMALCSVWQNRERAVDARQLLKKNSVYVQKEKKLGFFGGKWQIFHKIHVYVWERLLYT